MTDYYQILSVKPDVKPKDLKAAYEKQRASYDPEKHLDDSLFIELNMANHRVLIEEAYQALSDAKKRKIYDEIYKKGKKTDSKTLMKKLNKRYETLKKEPEEAIDEAMFEKIEAFIDDFQEAFVLLNLIKYYLSSATIPSKAYQEMLHHQFGYGHFQDYPFIKRVFDVYPAALQKRLDEHKKLKWIIGLSHKKKDAEKKLSSSEAEKLLEQLLSNDPFASGLLQTWLNKKRRAK